MGLPGLLGKIYSRADNHFLGSWRCRDRGLVILAPTCIDRSGRVDRPTAKVASYILVK
ncbi:unnamed protein product [Commensalibacter communis]|nr:unnamed protein product [Commensalibacter communis]CAI3930604.1 unnamed protein product [Commensalibacter communis]